ncbi:hypothetical protein Dimus_010365, partial [Dionaea muscipula]
MTTPTTPRDVIPIPGMVPSSSVQVVAPIKVIPDYRPSRKSPYMPVEVHKKMTKNSKYPQQRLKEFCKDNGTRYVGTNEHADSKFFQTIEDKESWLESNHINVYLVLLAKRIKLEYEVDQHRGRYTIVDFYFF